METIVKLKYIKQSAKKIRFVLDDVRGSKVNVALNKLDKLNKKAAFSIAKAIRSGLANLSNSNIDDNFNQGPVMKRFRPAAMGRATPIL